MTAAQRHIPSSVLRLLDCAPIDSAVVVLIRHSVRDDLPSDDTGYDIPITKVGRQIALELGRTLHNRLRTLHSSPLLRCMQTAQAISQGAGVNTFVAASRLLGDPGVFVLDDRRAWENWKQLGHAGVMHHLMTETEALPGMAPPEAAARSLVTSMLSMAENEPGVHVFVTHDLLVMATASRLLGRPLSIDDWPLYLEGAFFWVSDGGVYIAYRDHFRLVTDLLHATVGFTF